MCKQMASASKWQSARKWQVRAMASASKCASKWHRKNCNWQWQMAKKVPRRNRENLAFAVQLASLWLLAQSGQLVPCEVAAFYSWLSRGGRRPLLASRSRLRECMRAEHGWEGWILQQCRIFHQWYMANLAACEFAQNANCKC